jgi:hypothetical protein
VTEQLEQSNCIKFSQKLGDSQVETIQKIQVAFGDDAMSIKEIKMGYNQLAAHWWILSHALVGLQQAKMTRSLPN